MLTVSPDSDPRKRSAHTVPRTPLLATPLTGGRQAGGAHPGPRCQGHPRVPAQEAGLHPGPCRPVRCSSSSKPGTASAAPAKSRKSLDGARGEGGGTRAQLPGGWGPRNAVSLSLCAGSQWPPSRPRELPAPPSQGLWGQEGEAPPALASARCTPSWGPFQGAGRGRGAGSRGEQRPIMVGSGTDPQKDASTSYPTNLWV